MKKKYFCIYAAIISVFTAMAFCQSVLAEEMPLIEPSQISTGISTSNLYPAVSKDGKFIAWEAIEPNENSFGRTYKIAVMEIGQRNAISVGKDLADSRHPSFSIDTNALAYDAYQGKNRGIYIKNTEGQEKKLTQHSYIEFDPDFSPDGTRIAYCALESKSGDLPFRKNGFFHKLFLNSKKQPYIWVANSDGKGAVRIMPGVQPAFSPDGKKIAFAANPWGNYDIFIMNVNGSEIRQLTANRAANVEPTWSPDGRCIAFSSDNGGSWNIWRVKTDGSDLKPLISDTAVDGGPAWSKDGYIYFHSNRTGHFEIWRLKSPECETSMEFIDRDGDGIDDRNDKCPDQPEDKDGYMDEDGCPDPDNDGDGIPDDVDQCPNEPETFNGYKDEDGCPDTPPIPDKMILGTVKFKTKTKELLRDSYEELASLATKMDEWPTIKIQIRAYTDNKGMGIEANHLKLTKDRAEVVKAFLTAHGIDQNRLIAIGMGSNEPIDTNNTPVGREANNRIEIVLVKP